jgi:hypothetical protein
VRARALGRSAETDKQALCETSRVAPASPVLLVGFRFFYQFLPALDGLRACVRARSFGRNGQTSFMRDLTGRAGIAGASRVVSLFLSILARS